MFKILDRYIIRKFLGTYIFAIILLLAIVIVFDINEKLDAFLKAPLKATVMDYFVNFLPYFANQFSPLFTFIAVIFFTSKLAGNSEFIAMFSTGMSFRRLLRPYLISAAIIAAATFVLSAYIIPPANVKRIEYTNRYVRNKSVDYGANVMLMVAPGQIAYMASYENNSRTGRRFALDTPYKPAYGADRAMGYAVQLAPLRLCAPRLHRRPRDYYTWSRPRYRHCFRTP